MIHSASREILWGRFREFISPDADRYSVLKSILGECDLKYRIIGTEGSFHFSLDSHYKDESSGRIPVLLVAHYDRAEGSPGANDNSAAVFLLIETAMNLIRKNEKNWAVIFTDKEELKEGESIKNQGAFMLASKLKEMNMERARIFSFDACGTGDTLVISSTAEHFIKTDGIERLGKEIHDLQETALKTAHNLGTAGYILLPTPFSDDAGFLRAGIAAQTITMLPLKEANVLSSALRKNHDFPDSLVSSGYQESTDQSVIPQTWKNMNGANDTEDKLTPVNFSTVIRFAESLCTE